MPKPAPCLDAPLPRVRVKGVLCPCVNAQKAAKRGEDGGFRGMGSEFPGGPGASGIVGAAWRFESAGESHVKSESYNLKPTAMRMQLENLNINGRALPARIVEKARGLVREGASFFIANGIDREPEILVMGGRSEAFGKIVGFRLRYGAAVWCHDGALRLVTRENWKETWAKITPKAVERGRDPEPVRPRPVTSFDIMQPRLSDMPKHAGRAEHPW